MRLSLLSAVLAAALAAPAAAETSSVRLAELSFQLYAQGIAAGDPLLLLAAARLRQQVSFVPADRADPTLRRAERSGAAGEGSPPVSFEEMLAAAREAAGEDALFLAMIDDAEAEGARGVATGQVYAISQIRDGGTDTYNPLPFTGGEYAEVYVESRDGSDLNLYVYDEQGRLVCSDTDISSISYCGWRPSATGSFTIEVKNLGDGGAGYALMTN